jgi:hypothetical protein
MSFRHLIFSTIGLLCAAMAVHAAPIDTSLINLIATPREFDGKSVRVIGFAHLEFEGNAIYLHRDDDNAGALKNGLWIDVEKIPPAEQARLNGRYVLVEDTFSMDNKGHFGLWSGSIQKITRVVPMQRTPPPPSGRHQVR